MTDISDKFENCEIVVKAGPGGDNDNNIFRYVTSPLPAWVKSIDEQYYKKITTTALQAATEIVKETAKNITYYIKVSSSR